MGQVIYFLSLKGSVSAEPRYVQTIPPILYVKQMRFVQEIRWNGCRMNFSCITSESLFSNGTCSIREFFPHAPPNILT